MSAIITNSWWVQAQKPLFSALFHVFTIHSRSLTSISSSPKAPHSIDEDCDEFIPWLKQKAGIEISASLSIGKSSYGRALFAAEDIQPGDCLLKVPFTVQLAPDNLPSEISCLLGDEVAHVAKVALLILHEQNLGQSSEWAPYITHLPRHEDMHSTVFWSYRELEMIQRSALYKETLRTKAQIEKDFWAVKSAFDRFPHGFQDITLQEFTYAYGLVTSRAWESSRGVSMIPFADFLNHDCTSESYVLADEHNQHSEVIADRHYALGDQVLISYGKFSNATLLLDFGFTIFSNIYDQVQVELNIPQTDRLYAQKLELLDRYQMPSVKDVNKFVSSGNSFTIKEVRRGSKKGKGIPQSLRALCRVLSSKTEQELNALMVEASQSDGRLARHPFKNKNREVEAHQLLLSEIFELIKRHDAFIKLLESTPPRFNERRYSIRMRLAQDLLTGELRVLKSASVWLKKYCAALLTN